MLKKELLATFFLVILLGSGALLTNISPIALASTDSGEENESQETESNDDEITEEEEPETEPEPEDTPPAQTDEPPVPAEPLIPEAAIVPEPEVTDCPEGYVLGDIDNCVPEPLTELGELVGPPPECPPELGLTPLECLDKVVKSPGEEVTLPPCDGSAQDCVTPNGDICLVGQGGHECECAEDMSDCPNHPSLQEPPVTEPEPIDPCLLDPDNAPECPDPDPVTGECPTGYNMNENGKCFPEHDQCPKGYHSHEDDESGKCIPDSTPCDDGYIINPSFPSCENKERVCEEFPNIDECKTDDDDDNDDIDVDVKVINKVVNIVKDVNKRGHGNFPEIDIIGLSTKDNGDSMVCLINIDNEHVQCQEYGMPSDRVNGDFWRVIETDQDKDYDNGNTGSNDVDGVIDDIKSQDFSELDDATNHDFEIDLAWIAINPSGDGVACLAEDSTGKGKSLCEPFKVSSQEIDGQITEGVKFENS